MIDMAACKREFTEKLLEMKNNSAENHLTILTREDYNNLLKDLQTAKTAQKKTTLQYRRLKRFDIAKEAGVKKLIKKSTNTDSIRYYLPIDDIFDVLNAAHAVGHAGRDRLKAETAKTYANITTEMIKLFLSTCLCDTCHSKRTKKSSKCKPDDSVLQHAQLNTNCQVDLIDLCSQPDGPFNFILLYQDTFTQFILLKALKTNSAAETAASLADIFCILGAPSVLHTDNGREFAGRELEEMWTGLRVVRGGSRQVERASRDVKSMLAVWMEENASREWSRGVRFVQFARNQRVQPQTGQSAYKALFGMEPRIGVART